MNNINIKKKNNLTLYIIALGIILLIGMGISYYIYKNTGNNVETKEEYKKFNCLGLDECNNTFKDIDVKVKLVNDKVSLVINEKDVSNEIKRMYIDNYLITEDLVIVDTKDNSGGTSELIIFNKNGKKLYSVSEFDIGLFYINYEFKDNIITMEASLFSEEAQASAIMRDLSLANCSDLEKYKDNVAEIIYEMRYLDNDRFSELKEISTKELYKTDKYIQFKESCKNNPNLYDVQYDISLNSNMKEEKASAGLDYLSFNLINEGETFNYYKNNKLTLKNGIPTIYKNKKVIESSINNVDKIYILSTGTYEFPYAFLTKDGDIYIGQNIIKFTYDEIGYELVDKEEFNNVKKIISNNKYIELRTVFKGPITDDSWEIGLIGITSSGSRDLIKIN